MTASPRTPAENWAAAGPVSCPVMGGAVRLLNRGRLSA